jgi:Tfp pilus assembly protein PilO
VTLTDRDRKIVMLIVPLALIAAYWFLLLAPKREEAAKLDEKVVQEETKRDAAVSKAAQLDQAKRGFAEDYATVIQLGKATPTSVDMPSLLVQLDRAARGTGIDFDRIATGDRQGAPAPAASAQGGSGGSTQPGGNAQAGGAPAQTAPGGATEAANNTAANANGKVEQNGGGNASPSGPGAGAEGGSSGVAGLDSVPLDFEFTGNFFELADFFHRLKRFVRVANDRIIVRGRLMTIDALKFTAGDDFPQLKAEVKATVYLAPRAEGTSAGATPGGPAPSAPAAPENQSASSSPTPTATATP